ncbi:MAG: hypothetical protein ABIH37_05625 [archaeon]
MIIKNKRRMNTMTIKDSQAFMFLRNMNKKASLAFPILLLFLVIIALCILSLFTMVSYTNNFEDTVYSANAVSKANQARMQFDHSLGIVFHEASKDFIFSQGKKVFIENFKKELLEYKTETGNFSFKGFEGIESQLVDKNIELTPEKIVLKLKLSLKSGEVVDSRYTIIDYNYEKQFQKVFK